MRYIDAFAMTLVLSCGLAFGAEGKGKVNKQEFGKTPGGEPVELYTLTNKNGLEAKIMTYGATLVSLDVPDKSGKLGDVVLGFDSLAGYLSPRNPYFGATVGRYANRIGKARFTLDGVEYKLPRNDGENTLHGGPKGFDKVVWKVKHVDANSIELGYLSRDGDEGFPGNLNATVKFTLTDDNALRIDYGATTDKDTVVNLTNHSYFNLAGGGNILHEQLMINADRYTPVDSGLIPTGELQSVKGTPFDFREAVPVGARIDQEDAQLKLGRGYDHNYVLNKGKEAMSLAARVYDPKSGRVLEIETTEPGVQLYTANYLDGTLKGIGGVAYGPRSALCLETQHFPDSPNKPSFPSVVLKPGGHYHSTTIYKFSTR